MIESWLDAVIPWWRSAVDFYQQHFSVISIPLIVWMGVMFVGQRTNSVTAAAITTHLKKLGPRAYRMTASQLVDEITPVVYAVAQTRTWMPAFAGLWVQRCSSERLASNLGVNTRQILSLRDHTLGYHEPRARRRPSHV